MLGLRISRIVALAGSGLTLTGCPGAGQDTDSESDTDSSGTDTTDTDEPTTTLAPTTDPPPPPPPPPDITPPALLGAEFIDPQILRLTFTEPLAPLDQVNPKRFRLSVGRYSNDYYGNYDRTNYSDPEQYNHNSYCGENCYDDYYCYYQCYDGPPLALDVLDVLADAYNPAQVVLLLEQPATTNFCQFITAISGNPDAPAGLLLHYADGGATQIADLAGIPLLGFGETWVKNSETNFMYIDDVRFPELVPFLPIPCPF